LKYLKHLIDGDHVGFSWWWYFFYFAGVEMGFFGVGIALDGRFCILD
jgi:hypothetical protein